MIVDSLLKKPAEYCEKTGGRHGTIHLLAVTIATSFAYGISTGSYLAGEQIWLAGLKMSILFLGTFLIGFPLFYIFAELTIQTRIHNLFKASLYSIAVTTTCLAAFAPINFFLSISLPFSYHTYLFLVLFMVLLIALSGIIGVVQLYRGLRTMALDKHALVKLIIAWFFIYHFIGGQMGWLLRPFVGSSADIRGNFSIWRNLEGNIYEAIINATKRILLITF